MNFTRNIPVLPFGSWLTRRPDLQDKLLTKPERDRVIAMLERHEIIFEEASKTPSPQRALKNFMDEFGSNIPSTGPRFVRWAQAITEAAKLDPDQEWNLRDAVNQNIRQESVLIRAILADRLPKIVASIFDNAAAEAADFCSLLNISAAELSERVVETQRHIAARVAEAEEADAAGDAGPWLEQLAAIGIEI